MGTHLSEVAAFVFPCASASTSLEPCELEWQGASGVAEPGAASALGRLPAVAARRRCRRQQSAPREDPSAAQRLCVWTSAFEFCKPGFDSSVEVSGFSSMTFRNGLDAGGGAGCARWQSRGRRAWHSGSDGGGGAAARGTTVLCVRKGGAVVVIADGQVTQGAEIIKPNVRKVRRISEGVIGGFAGATADAFTLFERLESRIEEHPGTALANVSAATLEAIS
eukprot:SM000055S18302  [mRNA]  locus=s55:656809:658987:+ [translate_table: standard]